MKALKINESIENPWEPMTINENYWKPMEINENQYWGVGGMGGALKYKNPHKAININNKYKQK